MIRLVPIIMVCIFTGCASHTVLNSDIRQCKNLDIKKLPVTELLDSIPTYFSSGCYHHVIHYARWIRSNHSEKQWSVLSEFFSFFSPKGTVDAYTLEAYERSLLSFYIALSHYKLSKFELAKTELLRSYEELVSQSYNSGIDEINLALMAILWEKLDRHDYARPLWKKIAEHKKVALLLRRFASSRLRQIDDNSTKPLSVFSSGTLPKIEWQIGPYSSKSGFYSFKSDSSSFKTCRSKSSIRVPTARWNEILEQRYRADYHPYLNIKSATRLPIGIALTTATAAAGLSIAVGGCALTADSNSSDACGHFIEAGLKIAALSPGVWNYVSQPDLRRWDNLPSAIVISNQTFAINDHCLAGKSNLFF